MIDVINILKTVEKLDFFLDFYSTDGTLNQKKIIVKNHEDLWLYHMLWGHCSCTYCHSAHWIEITIVNLKITIISLAKSNDELTHMKTATSDN